jgi:hypothetical protein
MRAMPLSNALRVQFQKDPDKVRTKQKNLQRIMVKLRDDWRDRLVRALPLLGTSCFPEQSSTPPYRRG